MGCRKCRPPNGVVIKPDGVHELEPCLYEDKELHTKVDLTISQCSRCGHITFSWRRTEETEDIIYGELGPEPEED